jgi:hypothetical protein
MHGDLGDSDSIVVTRNDYWAIFAKRPLLRTRLNAMLLDKTFLFVGYGLGDPDFNQLRTEMHSRLGEHQRWAYMIITDPIDELTRKDLENSRIHVIEPKRPKSHASLSLTNVLKDLTSRSKTSSPFETIPGKENRTSRLIRTCDRLLENPAALKDSKYTIRIQATLSSFSISDKEQHNRRYKGLLLKERSSFMNLAKAGAHVRCIVSPSLINAQRPNSKEYFIARLKQLLRFLRDPAYSHQCEFVVFDEPRASQIIFGTDVVFEGCKVQIEDGFQFTMVARDRAKIDFDIRVFDELFVNMKNRLLSRTKSCALSEEAEQTILRKMVCDEVESALRRIRS